VARRIRGQSQAAEETANAGSTKLCAHGQRAGDYTILSTTASLTSQSGLAELLRQSDRLPHRGLLPDSVGAMLHT